MLPLFCTTDAICNKKALVNWPAVDIITDCNGLCKLLCWLNLLEGREVCDFQINVELIGIKIIVLGHWVG